MKCYNSDIIEATCWTRQFHLKLGNVPTFNFTHIRPVLVSIILLYGSHISALLVCGGGAVYPAGWDNREVRDCCGGTSSKYRLGECFMSIIRLLIAKYPFVSLQKKVLYTSLYYFQHITVSKPLKISVPTNNYSWKKLNFGIDSTT